MMHDDNSMPTTPIFDISVDPSKHRYPFCIVWVPIPLLSYLLPFIGHMGIATSRGVIRDFGGPYSVREDNMTFGWPTKYWQLDYTKAKGGVHGWDSSVDKASECFRGKMPKVVCDNCHSMVAKALNTMSYDNSSKWNMFQVAFCMGIHGQYVNSAGIMKTWIPCFITYVTIILLCVFL